jgi:hypothetical protein
MAVFDRPSAAAKTIRARVASRCWVVGRVAQTPSFSRSSSVKVIGWGWGPRGMAGSPVAEP